MFRQSPMFQFVHVVSSPIMEHHWKKPHSVFFWGTLLATDLQPHFIPLITALWFSEFWAQFTVSSSRLFFMSFHMKILWDTMSKGSPVLIDNVYCSPLNYQPIQFIGEGYQVGQIWFLLCKSMLTTPNCFLVLHVPEKHFQHSLFHDLARDWGEAEQPVVPWVSLSCPF